jgi:endonuclease/exonuclease/phosphatase (EEP) superfamily protein YafD
MRSRASIGRSVPFALVEAMRPRPDTMTIMNAVFAVVLGALAIPPIVGRALGGQPPDPAPKLAALAPAATVPAVAAVALAATYAWWLAILIAVPAAILAVWQVPPRRRPWAPAALRPRRAPNAGPAAHCVRLLTLNTQGGNASADVIVRRVRDHLVDVLAVQELTPDLSRSLAAAGLRELLPFSEVHARPGYAGTGIWSRWPLQPLPPVPGLVSAAPRAAVTIAGQPVTVTSVHLLAPVHGGERGWQRELGRLRSELTCAAGPQLVAGDFNATRDHRSFRKLLDAGFHDCADAAMRRRWPAFTWPAARPRLPVMRLDHVLATRPHFVVRVSRTLRVPGTDHRGVLAVVQVLDGPGQALTVR